jgi:hypothetical protein
MKALGLKEEKDFQQCQHSKDAVAVDLVVEEKEKVEEVAEREMMVITYVDLEA